MADSFNTSWHDLLSLLQTATSSSNTTTQATTISGLLDDDSDYLPNERLGQGLYLMMLALSGISLNILIFFFVLASKFPAANGFMLHACILDAFKSALCIPYSLSVLELMSPSYCSALGLAYVVTLTVSMFNLLALIMSEAFAFHEKNVSYEDDAKNNMVMCCIFGVVIIYIGSIILHLGPTLIGGEFKFNQDVGNCIFAYGKVQNYIVQIIWVVIMTLTLVVIFRYIYKFYRQLKANQRFRITALARNAAAYTKGKNPDDDIYETVNRLKKRVRVFLCMATAYAACWYPLFFLTLLDYKYTEPKSLYRILTIVAWSHSAIIPAILLCMDHTFGIVNICRRAAKRQQRKQKTMSPSTQPLTRDDSTMHGSQHTSLYNHTMTNAGKSVAFVENAPKQNRPKVNTAPSLAVNGGDEITKLSDPDELEDRPQATAVSGLLSDYDALSLEESPL